MESKASMVHDHMVHDIEVLSEKMLSHQTLSHQMLSGSAAEAEDQQDAPLINHELISVDQQDSLLIDQWLAGRPQTTADAYRRDVHQFARHAGAPLTQCSRQDVQAWIEHLEAAGRAASTRRRKLAAVSSLMDFLQAEGHVDRNEAGRVTAPKSRRRLSEKILTREEVRRLIWIGAAAGRDRLMLRVIYALALRVSDLTELRARDVRPADPALPEKAGLVDLFGKGDKEATLRCDGGPWALLLARAEKVAASRRGARGKIFPVSRQTVGRVVKRAAERTRLRLVPSQVDISGKNGAPRSRVSPHWLRHAAISHMLDAGVPAHEVRAFARHASLETTTLYAHARPEASPGSVLDA